jgi:DNA-binding NarL/FixJ family response regulator
MTVSAVSEVLPRIIIADDDPTVRAALGMALSRGFELVGVAVDSEEAITLAQASQPDAAVIDVEMPKGGGLHAVRGIHHVAPGTAIVVISGDESDALVRELVQAGATTYRRKGVGIAAIAQALVDSIKAHSDGRVDSL